MADTSAIDAAVVGVLIGDATLAALMPDGVYFDLAAHGATRFVIVSQLTHADSEAMNGRVYEELEYLVKAVALSTTGADVKTAAARIDTLLQGVTLTPTGYAPLRFSRSERVRYTEADDENEDARWSHRGGLYKGLAST